MRVAFSLAILCFAALYTSLAFGDLAFLSSAGRLGPAFFPRIIGVGLLVICLYNLYFDLKRRHEDGGVSEFWGITLVVALLSGAFVVGLEVLGGLVATALFMIVSLSILNRRQWVANLVLSAVLPVGIYFLFRVWLKAAWPDSLLAIAL